MNDMAVEQQKDDVAEKETQNQDASASMDEELTEPADIDAQRDHKLWPLVRDALKEIYDPEIPVNIYELGLIYAVKFLDSEDGTAEVDVKMTLTSPGCPVAQEMPGWIQGAIFPIEGVSEVDVEIIWDPPWDPSKMSETAKMQLNMFY